MSARIRPSIAIRLTRARQAALNGACLCGAMLALNGCVTAGRAQTEAQGKSPSETATIEATWVHPDMLPKTGWDTGRLVVDCSVLRVMDTHDQKVVSTVFMETLGSVTLVPGTYKIVASCAVGNGSASPSVVATVRAGSTYRLYGVAAGTWVSLYMNPIGWTPAPGS